MTLIPDAIADCQMRLAQGERAGSIALKMTQLCEQLGTTARCLKAEKTLEILGA